MEFCMSEVYSQGMKWLISAEASPWCADGVLSLCPCIDVLLGVFVSYLPLLTIELRPTLMALLRRDGLLEAILRVCHILRSRLPHMKRGDTHQPGTLVTISERW